jgi:hypothetical protein
MSWTASSPIFASAVLLLLGGCRAQHAGPALLHADDFASAENWVLESEQPARVAATLAEGRRVLDIDTPAGLTLWFKPRLTGPVEIQFDATAVSEGGANDHVSDLNVFWMATNRDGTAPFPSLRGGRFAAYNDLLTYYVGLGGNRNSTSRFRRYIGHSDLRPLRPEHDLSSADVLLVPNRKQTITLVADRNTIEYRRDGNTLFRLHDPAPYTGGWFAIRTTQSHLRIERLRIHALPAR